MCLIAVAHQVSDSRPLVIVANRDEDYDRPTLPAGFWDDASDVIAGRDRLHGGTWLAITKSGRFAAVTNLRGSSKTADSLSRGALVSDFVRGTATPREAVADVATKLVRYAGFHLLCGMAGGDLWFLSGAPLLLGAGVHAVSNAPAGEVWPKTETAARFLSESAGSATPQELLEFLAGPPATGDPTHDVFIVGDRYGTRSSTVIVAGADEIHFLEQTYSRGGVRAGEPVEFRFRLRR